MLPEGQFAAKIGPDEFRDVLLKYGGEGAVEDWYKVVNHLTKPGIVGAVEEVLVFWYSGLSLSDNPVYQNTNKMCCLHRISDAESECIVW